MSFALIALLAASPPAKIEIVPAPPPVDTPLPLGSGVSYDEALRCAIITMHYGLELHDSGDEAVQERALSLMELMQRFKYRASRLSGKPEREINEDMTGHARDILQVLDESEDPDAAFGQMAALCEDTARTAL